MKVAAKAEQKIAKAQSQLSSEQNSNKPGTSLNAIA